MKGEDSEGVEGSQEAHPGVCQLRVNRWQQLQSQKMDGPGWGREQSSVNSSLSESFKVPFPASAEPHAGYFWFFLIHWKNYIFHLLLSPRPPCDMGFTCWDSWGFGALIEALHCWLGQCLCGHPLQTAEMSWKPSSIVWKQQNSHLPWL